MPRTEKQERNTNTRVSREKKTGFLRCALLGVFLIAVTGFYVLRLAGLQLKSADGTYTLDDGARVTVTKRYVTVQAVRGQIRDRDGVPLVRNETHYHLVLDADTFPRGDEDANALLHTLYSVYEGQEDLLRTPSFPITQSMADGRYYYFVHTEELSVQARNRYTAYLETLGLDAAASPDADTVLDAMFSRYHLYAESGDEAGAEHGELLYPKQDAYRIAAVRYDLETLAFDSATPYRFASDADVEMIAAVLEKHLRGADFRAETERVYCYPGYASHILGRTGKIQEAMAEHYASLGYPMDAIVGIDGAEAAFEEQLRGKDGQILIEEDQAGNIIRETVIREAVAGRDVWLTIRIGLQIKAEQALAANIDHIVQNALLSGKEHAGEDANAGALIVMDPNNGEILACASNPTYNLATFSEDYASLIADKNIPLLNRPLMGTYAPGSTFKVGVAACAMEDGLLTPETVIDTKGIYTFYPDYQPRCWLYVNTGLSHGPITVTDALRDSCNYFFFEVGRQLGIQKIADYMTGLGLGQKTGTELPETAGILSSPAYTNAKNMPWTGAATLQTAIGQGYNAVTPVQLASYLSTIANGGKKYPAHFLLGVTNAGSDTAPRTVRQSSGSVQLSEETHETLVNAMMQVAESGSALRVFQGYPIPVAAKTGTAEGEETSSPNGVFAAFAPAEKPEILCVSVIENGASGTSTGLCVRDVFDEWFHIK